MTPQPLAGTLVEVLGQTGKTAITDAEGRYKIPIAGGEYMVQFTGEGMSPITMKVVVSPGVDRRVNVVFTPMGLSPAPVAEAVPEAPMPKLAITPPPASMEAVLSGALEQLSGNGAMVNGVG